MTLNRRRLFTAGLTLGLTALATRAQAAPKSAAGMPLVPNAATPQTAALQSAIDDAAARRVPLDLPAGVFKTGTLVLRNGTTITGKGNLTTLAFTGGTACLTAKGAANIKLSEFAIDGGFTPFAVAKGSALVTLEACTSIDIGSLTITRSSAHGIALTASSGRIANCTLTGMADAALFALDCLLTVTGNTIDTCGNNGILVWRSQVGEDGSAVTGNRITRVRSDAGGTGENGNGVNVYRAASVQVSGNHITDCAYSAVRGNAASNIQITGNHCQRLGEVALYAEFGFTGALISNNIVDGAATGISVTNFNEGGRLAVVQGNLIRNLVRREHEPVDKRGEGIGVEADTLVTGNTIENAPTCGIQIGWGSYMRDVSATNNLLRGCRTGVLVSSDPGGGRVLIAQNLISGSKEGAIRAHDRGRVFGPDLTRDIPVSARVTISGNAIS